MSTASSEIPVLESAPALHCRHCGLPLSRARRLRGDAFCCSGCRKVHALIQESGLDRYYDLRRGPGLPPSPPAGGDFAWLDPLLVSQSASAVGPARIDLDVQGIHCTGCVWLLNTLFGRHAAGTHLCINPALGRAEIVWDSGRQDLRAWLREAESFGYRFGPPQKTGSASRTPALLMRLGVTTALAMNVMVFSFCYYLGLGRENAALYRLFGQLSLVFTALAVLVGGEVFFRAAWQGLRRGIAHLDLPIAAGLLLGFAGSTVAYLRHGPEAAYFDTVAVFATLMLTGRWLQERILERNRHALLADSGSDYLMARCVRDGTLAYVPYREIQPGDELWVVPGDVVPVSGMLVSEPATVRLDWITGESAMRSVATGDLLEAGSIQAGSATMRVIARERFADSSLFRLLVRSAPPARPAPPGVRRHFGAFYVAAVFVLAATAFLVWSGHGIDRAIRVAVAVLVVTCPCALGLAWPLANELAHLALRRRGIFVRQGDFFERARSIRRIVFDKTGTLTAGGVTLDAESRETLGRLAPEQKTILWNMATRSNHPLSRALEQSIDPAQIEFSPELEVCEVAGQGLEAIRDGRRFRLGRRSFAERKTGSPVTFTEAVFSMDARECGVFRFEETLREDAREEVEHLERSGYTVFLLSGDTEERVERTAERLGIPADRALGGRTPDEKASWIRAHDRRDTLMVGDGLNDGPAFDAAFVTATPAIEHPALPGRADFYFLGEEVGAVRCALATAARLRWVWRGNLAFALSYNAFALVLCFMGVVTPLLAALLMPISSALVVYFTVLRLRPGRSAWMS